MAKNRAEIYEQVEAQIVAVLEGESDRIAQMATVCCLLSEAFIDRYYWTGFYLVDKSKGDELVVGPYQGTLGCLRIAFGRGVCGEVAANGETMIVEDVHAHAGHIACDHRTNSEIVVPVYDTKNHLIAVFDVDSTYKAAFDASDQMHLEKILRAVFGKAE